jgi:hypothetical protein
MNAVGAIRKIILDDATTVAMLFNSTSVYPTVLPQEKQYPAVVLALKGVRPNDSKTQVSGVDNVQVACMVFADTYNKVQQISDSVRACIDGFIGSVTTSDSAVHDFDLIRYMTEEDGFDQENRLFIRDVVYEVRFKRDVPPLPFGAPYVSSSKAWMALLPVYDSDESAVADGLGFEDVYMTADNHVSGMGGVPKQVRLQ